MQTETYYPKQKKAIQALLTSLTKHVIFRDVVQTPIGVKLVGYKWEFVQERKKRIRQLGIKYDSLHKISHKDQVLLWGDVFMALYAVIF